MVILDIGAIVDHCGFVGVKLVLLRQWVVVLDKHGSNVFIHSKFSKSNHIVLEGEYDLGVVDG